MRRGDRVEVVASWSTFRGMRGRVDSVAPYLMVVLDDDPRPVRMGETEVMLVGSERDLVAGE